MDLYGSQLWNYGSGYPETFHVTWSKVIRLNRNYHFVHTVIYYIQLIIVILLNSYSKSGVLNFSTFAYRATI